MIAPRAICIVAALAAQAALVSARALDIGAQAAKKVRYPHHDADGRLLYEFFGDEARVLPDGKIYVVNLKAVFYEGGRKMMEVTSPQCHLDREGQSAASTGTVRVARSEMVLTGRGYEVCWTNNLGRLRIHNEARLVFKRSAEP